MTHIYRYGYMHPLPWMEEPNLDDDKYYGPSMGRTRVVERTFNVLKAVQDKAAYGAWLDSRIPVPEECRQHFDEGCSYQEGADFRIQKQWLREKANQWLDVDEMLPINFYCKTRYVAIPIIKTNKEGPIHALAGKMDEAGLRVTFGLQLDHIRIIESKTTEYEGALYQNHTWQEIGKKIGWHPLTAALYYFRYLAEHNTSPIKAK